MEICIFQNLSTVSKVITKQFATIGIKTKVKEPAEETVKRTKIDIAIIVGFGQDTIDIVKLVHKYNLNAFIVCVCANTDDVKDLITAGASDWLYYDEIVNERFLPRMNLWINVARFKKYERAKDQSGKNAFGVSVWGRRVKFEIQDEHSLEFLWEYFLNDKRFDINGHGKDWIQACYMICSKLISENIKPTVTFEENNTYFFLTISGLPTQNREFYDALVDYAAIENVRFLGHGFKYKKGVFSLYLHKDVYNKIAKKTQEMPDATIAVLEHNDNMQELIYQALQTISYKKEQPKNLAIKLAEYIKGQLGNKETTPVCCVQEYATSEQTECGTLIIYNFLEKTELAEISSAFKEVDSMLSVLQYSTLTHDDVLELANILSRVSSILSSHNQTFKIAITLHALSVDIKTHIDVFIEKSKNIAMLFGCFINDLKDWRDAIFITGAPNENFMDANIIANASMIADLIKPQSEIKNNIDDVFAL